MEPRLALDDGRRMSVIWITGLAGAGKTSIATEVVGLLRTRGTAAILLDGDAVRVAFGDGGYDRSARLAAAYRISRLAQLVARQETIAVVATLSLFHEVHAFNRAAHAAYFEVLVECEEAVLRQRSPLYARINAGEIVGRDIPAEFPRSPHLVVRNEQAREEIASLASQILTAWSAHVGLR